MDEIIEAIRESIADKYFGTREKKAIKQLIREGNYAKRDMDYLRSQIFDIARANTDHLSKQNLIYWIEETNKLTLLTHENTHHSHAYFSPGTECKAAINAQLRGAVSSVKICVFTISDNEISNEIIAAHNRGVGVKILTDNDKTFDRGSDIEMLSQKGIPVEMDTSPNHMHHKFCIIDKQVLLTGSYNWTRSAAERNQENILLTEDPLLVQAFLKEFDRLSERLIDY